MGEVNKRLPPQNYIETKVNKGYIRRKEMATKKYCCKCKKYHVSAKMKAKHRKSLKK